MSVDLDELRRERRVESRREFCVYLTQSVDAELDKNDLLTCHSIDISKGGIKMTTFSPLQVGRDYHLKVGIGDEQSVGLTAEVKWCLEVDSVPTYYIGFKILSIEKGLTDKWNQFIEGLG